VQPGPLHSTGVPPLRRYHGSSRHRLVFGRLPGVAGHTAYLAPPISRRDEDGFSSCSACPCHRAAPITPPECHDASIRSRRVMLPSPERGGLGLRTRSLTGPPVGSLALRPGDSPTTPRVALSIGFTGFVSSTGAIQATRSLILTSVGLSPTEHASLRWTHVGSRAGAVTLGFRWLYGLFRVPRLSPACRGSVSSPRRIARSVRISRTTRSCTLLAQGYGAHQAGAAFVEVVYETRYSLKSLSSSYSHRLLHRFQPKPRRCRARARWRRILFSTQFRMPEKQRLA